MSGIEVSRAAVMELCKMIEAERPAAQRGRKPQGATRDVEILREIDRMAAAGEISLEHGGPTAAARLIC